MLLSLMFLGRRGSRSNTQHTHSSVNGGFEPSRAGECSGGSGGLLAGRAGAPERARHAEGGRSQQLSDAEVAAGVLEQLQARLAAAGFVTAVTLAATATAWADPPGGAADGQPPSKCAGPWLAGPVVAASCPGRGAAWGGAAALDGPDAVAMQHQRVAAAPGIQDAADGPAATPSGQSTACIVLPIPWLRAQVRGLRWWLLHAMPGKAACSVALHPASQHPWVPGPRQAPTNQLQGTQPVARHPPPPPAGSEPGCGAVCLGLCGQQPPAPTAAARTSGPADGSSRGRARRPSPDCALALPRRARRAARVGRCQPAAAGAVWCPGGCVVPAAGAGAASGRCGRAAEAAR